LYDWQNKAKMLNLFNAGRLPPKSGTGESPLQSRWSALTRFLDDGCFSLSRTACAAAFFREIFLFPPFSVPEAVLAMGHLNRGIDGVFEIVRVVGRSFVSVAEVHAIFASAAGAA
jgi:hypothetical protein